MGGAKGPKALSKGRVPGRIDPGCSSDGGDHLIGQARDGLGSRAILEKGQRDR